MTRPSVLLVTVAIAAALSLAACDSPVVTTTPGVSASPAPTATPLDAASPSASSSAALTIDEEAYLVGDAFPLTVGDAGGDWTAPARMPVMQNGQPAMRVAFLPSSCPAGDVVIMADPAPEDTWETDLREDGTEQGYTFGSWPAAQVPECSDGHGRTYLEVGYHPIAPLEPIHLVASSRSAEGAPTEVELVPVFTSADATLPAFTMTGFLSQGALPGREKPRGEKPKEVVTSTFGRVTLPDGTAPTAWALRVSGCGSTPGTPIVVTARIGGAAPIELGSCSEGSIQSDDLSWPLPADGTPVTVLMAGGTTKSQVRVSEFQWREESP